MTTTGKKPVAALSFFPVRAAIWRNTNDKGAFFTVTFERSYKDGTGHHSSTSFTQSDLLILAKCADLAHTKIEALKAQEREKKETDFNSVVEEII